MSQPHPYSIKNPRLSKAGTLGTGDATIGTRSLLIIPAKFCLMVFSKLFHLQIFMIFVKYNNGVLLLQLN